MHLNYSGMHKELGVPYKPGAMEHAYNPRLRCDGLYMLNPGSGNIRRCSLVGVFVDMAKNYVLEDTLVICVNSETPPFK